MNFLHLVNLKSDGWLWYFPQYHAVMFVLVLMVIGLMVGVIRRLRNLLTKLDLLIAHTILTTCPCCHRDTLATVQECTSPACRSIRILKNKKGGAETPPLQSVPGD
jgi:hypothetical protein